MRSSASFCWDAAPLFFQAIGFLVNTSNPTVGHGPQLKPKGLLTASSVGTSACTERRCFFFLRHIGLGYVSLRRWACFLHHVNKATHRQSKQARLLTLGKSPIKELPNMTPAFAGGQESGSFRSKLVVNTHAHTHAGFQHRASTSFLS